MTIRLKVERHARRIVIREHGTVGDGSKVLTSAGASILPGGDVVLEVRGHAAAHLTPQAARTLAEWIIRNVPEGEG